MLGLIYRNKILPASPPVAALTPKYPDLGSSTFSALRHSSKSSLLLVNPLLKNTWKKTNLPN